MKLHKFGDTVKNDSLCRMENYPGQKKIYGFYHKIINQIPKHKIYYEVFAGSGAIAKLLIENYSDAKFFLNDIDESITDQLICIFRHKAEILNLNAKLLLNLCIPADTDTFIFLDPPYLHSTRPNNTQLYKYEMTDADHKQMLSSVLQLNCNVMIVHPVCELYDTWLKGWRKVLVKVRYHNKTSLECLYMNYEVPSTLQTDAYLGTDCWDRQRIKRKAMSLVQKLSALPELERNYVINRVQQKFI